MKRLQSNLRGMIYPLVKLALRGMELIRRMFWNKTMWWQVPVLGKLAAPLVRFSYDMEIERCGGDAEAWANGECK